MFFLIRSKEAYCSALHYKTDYRLPLLDGT